MAIGIRIDLRKLGERLPDGVRRAVRRTAKVAEKPIAVADSLVYPEQHIDPVADKLANPVVSGRLKHCTIETRAHIVGLADLPALSYDNARHIPITLFRLRVERPDGDVETCVRQHFPVEIRRLAPGSSVRALAHESDPRFVVLDWKTTGERMGVALTWPGTADQYKWPAAGEWPGVNAIEVRDTVLRSRRLAERRAAWTPMTARLLSANPTGGWTDGRPDWKVGLEVDGRAPVVKERMPDLAVAKLAGFRDGETKLGVLVTTIDVVANVGAPIAVLVSPKGEVAVDWEATLNQRAFRDTEPV